MAGNRLESALDWGGMCTAGWLGRSRGCCADHAWGFTRLAESVYLPRTCARTTPMSICAHVLPPTHHWLSSTAAAGCGEVEPRGRSDKPSPQWAVSIHHPTPPTTLHRRRSSSACIHPSAKMQYKVMCSSRTHSLRTRHRAFIRRTHHHGRCIHAALH
jgi:hypothetical protein